MNDTRIECLGCHRNNSAGNVFCVYCRRKLRVAERPVAPAAVIASAPAKQSWWQKVLH